MASAKAKGTQGRVRYAGEKVTEVIWVSGSTQLENSTRLDALVVTEG
jgi:hypothetical protein